MKHCLIAVLLLASFGCSQNRIIEKPILFDDERTSLSLQYMEERYGIKKEYPTIEPRMIVVHWTQIPTFEESFEAFYPAKLPDSRPEIAGASALNVSAQYLVDRDGKIYQLMPDSLMARHVIGLNHCAIGIENVGGTTDKPLTDDQLAANEYLIRYLTGKYPIDYLIGHYEYPRFQNHELWKEKDPGYRTKKVDPGRDFMARLRSSLSDLEFQPIPGQ